MGLLGKLKKTEKPEVKVSTKKKTAASDTKTLKTTLAAAPSAKVGASVLIAPLLSEKTTLQETMGQYTFLITNSATKVDVKKAVTLLYGVKPVRVNIVHMDGKRVRFGKRFGQRANYKKAIVTLPKDKQISIHAGV